MGCYNSAKINAPIENVWSALRNFHDLSWAPHVIEDVRPIGERRGTQVGAERILNNAFNETLLELDLIRRAHLDATPRMEYRKNYGAMGLTPAPRQPHRESWL